MGRGEGRSGAWFHDVRTGAVQWAGALYDILGLQAESKASPWDLCEALPSDVQTQVGQLLKRPESFALLVPVRGGEYVEISGEPVIEDGKVVSWFGQLKVAEPSNQLPKLLETDEILFRTLADTIPAHVWILGSNFHPQYWNRRLVEYTGLTDEQVRGRGTMGVVHPDDLSASLRVLRHAMRSKKGFELRQRILGRDGNYRWFLVRGVCVLGKDGSVKYLAGIATDIQGELETKEELERFKEILQFTGDFVFTTDPTGQLVYMNPAGRRLMGLTEEDPVDGLSVVPLHTQESVDLILADALPESIERGYWAGETCLLDSNGNEIPTTQSIVSHKNAQGNPTYFSTIARDITAQKRTAEELARARDAAMAATKAKSLFLATMSHEIKTPLNGIIGLTSLLATRLNDRGEREIASAIQSSSESLLRIINDILDFSKAEAGKISVEPHPCNLVDICRDVMGLYQAHAEQKGIELTVSTPPQVPRVLADALRLRQVLSNLVSNAIKFTSEGAVSLRLKVLEHEGQIRALFDVADTGIGIDQGDLEHLFQSFTQADPSIARRFGGTGLGLAIVKSLTELMGGRITCTSTPGVGSVFSASFVFSEVHDASEHDLATLDEKVSRHILLVEDNEVNQFVATQILQDLGCTVDVVDNGIAAISATLAREYDLVLMDMNMPLCDGLEATRAIRAQETERRTPVVALTANADSESRQSCSEAGMDGLLAKPFTLSQLHDVIRHYSASLR